MADLITYESIYEGLRKEKYESEMQKLSPGFFAEVINYLKEKKSILDSQKSQDSIFSQEAEKTEKQLQNVKKLIRELYDRRENKLLQMAIFTSRTGIPADSPNLLKEEEELYNSLIDVLKNYRGGILDNILALKNPQIIRPKDIKKEKQESTKLVRFLYPIPKFMGEDLNIYGPFNSEDIANLPPKVAQLLINKKRVKEVKG
ncbi:MAG: hypothetical protein ABIB47_05295 [Candidatus Woesearchaeota archaeon]